MALTTIKTAAIADDAITTSKLAAGTDGHVITYDASGNPTTVGPGTDGQVLTSTGAGSPPAFEAIPAGVGGATGVDFNDDVKARFGTGNDLEIYHSGSHSIIRTATGSTGDLNIWSDNNINLGNIKNSGEDYIKCIEDGAVELYYDNSKKIETVTGGATITGTCTATAFAGNGSALTNISAGKILQVVQEIKTNKQTIQSQTPVDIADFEATLTPSATSSKILIELTLSVCCHASGLLKIWRKKGSDAYAQLTGFLGDADGNRERTTLHVGQTQTANTETRSIIILDSPNTTDPVKYKWQGYTPSHATYIMTICGSVQDTDSNYYARPISTMTLKEVGI